MDLGDMKVNDAREYMAMVESVVGLINIHVSHVAICSGDHDHGIEAIKDTIDQMSEDAGEPFWSIPRSLAYIEAKKSIQNVLEALDKTQAEVPK